MLGRVAQGRQDCDEVLTERGERAHRSAARRPGQGASIKYGSDRTYATFAWQGCCARPPGDPGAATPGHPSWALQNIFGRT